MQTKNSHARQTATFLSLMLAISLLAGAGCGGEKPMVDVKSLDKAKAEAQAKATGTEPTKKASIANPATTKCVDEKLELRKIMKSEGESIICTFDDGTECEEWAYFRGECKKGDCKDWETCVADKTKK